MIRLIYSISSFTSSWYRKIRMQIMIISSKKSSIPNSSKRGMSEFVRASGWKFSGPIDVGRI